MQLGQSLGQKKVSQTKWILPTYNDAPARTEIVQGNEENTRLRVSKTKGEGDTSQGFIVIFNKG